MNTAEFRQLGHALIDWVANYRDHIQELPVMSNVRPGEVTSQFPTLPPQKGGELAIDTLLEIEKTLMPGLTHWNHPGFLAYFPSNSQLSSVLADLLCAGLGAQGMSWQTSPAATELEDVVMEWLRQMLGLSDHFTGVIHDTASTATLCALICARERCTAFGQVRGGMQEESEALIIYASTEAHSSVTKAALLAGFGKDNIRLIETDHEHALSLEALAKAIAQDLDMGKRPCAIVATVGTTATTALDPVKSIAELAADHGIWLHVDAALAGSAMVCPECRWMWEGIEQVDSLVMNPHKWMGTGFDLSAYFVQDPEHLIRVMSTNPSYLRTAQDGQVRNLRDWGIPLGRRFRALKLWFLIKDLGIEGIQSQIRRDIANAQWLKAQVEQRTDWELLAPVPLQTVCLRHMPSGIQDPKSVDQHNIAIVNKINERGRFYLTSAQQKGRQIIRVSIGTHTTERSHLEEAWAVLRQVAEEV